MRGVKIYQLGVMITFMLLVLVRRCSVEVLVESYRLGMMDRFSQS
nr:MAG TPA: hypothetical protein [Caudoviricetes sp.]